MNCLKYISIFFLLISSDCFASESIAEKILPVGTIIAALNSVIISPQDTLENMQRYFNLRRAFIYGLRTYKYRLGTYFTFVAYHQLAHACHDIPPHIMEYLLTNAQRMSDGAVLLDRVNSNGHRVYVLPTSEEFNRAEYILSRNKKNQCLSCRKYQSFLEQQKKLVLD